MTCALVRGDIDIQLQKMSITRWFKPKSSEQANDEAYQAAQRFVDEQEAVMKGRKRKRSAMHHYTAAVKTAIGKHALQFGNKSAVVQKRLEEGVEISDTQVNLKTLTLKPIHFKWLTTYATTLLCREKFIFVRRSPFSNTLPHT